MNMLINLYDKISNDNDACDYYSLSGVDNHGIIYKFHGTTIRTLLTLKTDCDEFNDSIGIHRSEWKVSQKTGQELPKQYVSPLENSGLIIPNGDRSIFSYTEKGKFVKKLNENKKEENWLLLFILLADKLEIIKTSYEFFSQLRYNNINLSSVLTNLFSIITPSRSNADGKFYEFLTYETFYKVYKEYDFLRIYSRANLMETQEYINYVKSDKGVFEKKISIVTNQTIKDDAKLLYLYYLIINSKESIDIDNIIKWYIKPYNDTDIESIDIEYIYNMYSSNKELFDLAFFNNARKEWIDSCDTKKVNLEKEYKNWLLNDKDPIINNEESANSYISSMKKVYSEFNKYKDYDSIFNIDNVSDAEAYFQYIVNNADFKTKYLDEKNYAARSGFKNYIEFLDSIVRNKKYSFYDYKKPGEGINLVIYGTPGCGKSFILNEMLRKPKYKDNDGNEKDGLSISEENIIRTTFHHDYSNTDFIGQIVPQVNSDGSATYRINPGPFTKALTKALQTNEPVALVIEELNRGDAAGILGDIFQLLDRFKETNEDKNEYKGVSRYAIENNLIQTYLTEHTDYKFDSIRIPSNLYIFATMNTSDQNVFTLDTAFKRRWEFLKLRNNYDIFKKDSPNLYVPGSSMLWSDFVKKLNAKMLGLNGQINEDKQLGLYFVDKDLLAKKENEFEEVKTKKFASKVLEYLWDDVVRYDHPELFDNKIKTLDGLIDKFVKYAKEKEESTSVFKVDTFNQNENE